MTKLKISKRAFSLIELSFVIMMVSVIFLGLLSVSISNNTSSKLARNIDRIVTIDRALRIYIAKNQKLPCPAAINLDKGNPSYGVAGSCIAGSGFYTSGTLIYGMVPVKDLNLSISFTEDSYGSKIAYIVDSTFATIATPSNFSESANKQGGIAINGYDYTSSSSSIAIDPNAIFAIISYGSNKKGAISSISNSALDASSDLDEIDNGYIGFNQTLTASTNRINSSFDDVVFFRNKKNFLLDSKTQESLGKSNYSGLANLKPSTDCSAIGINGIIDGTVLPIGVGLVKNCNAPNFNDTNYITYTCSSAGVISNIVGSCTCNAGNSLVASDCQPQCAFSGSNAKTGIATSTTVDYTTTATNISCNDTANNFNTSDSINYTCIGGIIAVTSGACDTCASTHTFVGGVCQPKCTFSGSNAKTGIATSTTVDYTTTATNISCNDTANNFNTSDSINYTCTGGIIAVTSGACDTCATGYVFNGSVCVPLLTCSGGVMSCTVGSLPNCSGGRVIHKFNSTSGTNYLNCTSGSTDSLNVLIVGGGGAGAKAYANSGGGGGGGQVIQLSGLHISAGDSISVVVGAGGLIQAANVNGGNGGNTTVSFSVTSSETLAASNRLSSSTTAGGGGGGGVNKNSSNNGNAPSGGGGGGSPNGTTRYTGGTGVNTGGMGYTSGSGGGGGSTQSIGGNASTSIGGNGGSSATSTIAGATGYYGGGGGGGSRPSSSTSSGATGGTNSGGNGAGTGSSSIPNAQSGVANTGGGGGGGGICYNCDVYKGSSTPGAGGSGVVIFSYPRN